MEGTRGPEEEGEGDVTVTGEIRSVEVGRVDGGGKGNTCGTATQCGVVNSAKVGSTYQVWETSKREGGNQVW